MIQYTIVYKITNLLNNKFYIGLHKQYEGFGPFEFDTYLGSGTVIKQAVEKYGKNNFTRETLYAFVDREEAGRKEKELITPDLILSKDCYNINPGGEGSYSSCQTPEARGKSNKTKMELYGSPAGACHSPEARRKCNNTTLERFGSVAGQLHTEEVIESSAKTRENLYGSSYAMMHTEEAKEAKRLVLRSKFKEKVPTLDNFIEVRDVENNKLVWSGKLYHFNVDFRPLRFPKGNTKEVVRAYKILSGGGRFDYIRIKGKSYNINYK